MVGNNYKSTIIGAGSMGVANMDEGFPFRYSHVEVIQHDPRTSLVAIVDVDFEKARKTGERFNVPYYTDWRVMMGEVKPDLVSVAAGPNVNVEFLNYVLSNETGVRGVYCDKPLALSLSNLDGLVELERNSGA